MLLKIVEFLHFKKLHKYSYVVILKTIVYVHFKEQQENIFV